MPHHYIVRCVHKRQTENYCIHFSRNWHQRHLFRSLGNSLFVVIKVFLILRLFYDIRNFIQQNFTLKKNEMMQSQRREKRWEKLGNWTKVCLFVISHFFLMDFKHFSLYRQFCHFIRSFLPNFLYVNCMQHHDSWRTKIDIPELSFCWIWLWILAHLFDESKESEKKNIFFIHFIATQYKSLSTQRIFSWSFLSP